jgi:uncharacterized membrane protein YobD (UPF0266 family)
MTKTKQRKRTGLHREGRRMLLIVCLVVFILNITAYFYWPHWILATLLALSALALVFVVYFFRDLLRVSHIIFLRIRPPRSYKIYFHSHPPFFRI